jgi:hypothetical protein
VERPMATYYSSSLSVCPRIRKDRGRLIASTSWRVSLMTLGAVHRRVIVDPQKEAVFIRDRYAWVVPRRRRIPFGSIAAVTYGYQDLAGWPGALGHKSSDWFSVGLWLHNRNAVRLFSFSGEGTFTNDGPFPDWCYWDQWVLDFSGTQESESRVFAEVLGKMIGVPIEPPKW